jgi:hypothetical protein
MWNCPIWIGWTLTSGAWQSAQLRWGNLISGAFCCVIRFNVDLLCIQLRPWSLGVRIIYLKLSIFHSFSLMH